MKWIQKWISIALSRIWKRPIPLLLSYGTSLIAALCFGLMLTSSTRSLFRRPLLIEAINTRSLDLLLDVMSAPVENGSPFLTLAALVLLPLVYLLMWVVRIVIEGGALKAYDSEEHVPVGTLFRMGARWIMPFFGQGLLSLGVYVLSLVIPVMLAWLTRNTGGGVVAFINTTVMITFGLLACGWTMLAEIARAYAVVDDERNIGASLWETYQIVRRKPLSVLAWYSLCAVISFVFMLLAGVINRNMPVQWWPLNLIVLQVISVLRLGLRLTRWSMNVSLVQAALQQDQFSSGTS